MHTHKIFTMNLGWGGQVSFGYHPEVYSRNRFWGSYEITYTLFSYSRGSSRVQWIPCHGGCVVKSSCTIYQGHQRWAVCTGWQTASTFWEPLGPLWFWKKKINYSKIKPRAIFLWLPKENLITIRPQRRFFISQPLPRLPASPDFH